MSNKDRLRVVIVGGGIAGLTLANALEQADVEYVLLERRAELAPQVGASIGVFPNGARILDQLGAWEAVENGCQELNYQYNQDSEGRQLGPPINANPLSTARSGYSISWGDRQIVLEKIYENLRDKSKALTSKRVVDVVHAEDGVTVRCSDGSTYQADILVGADGVFSKTREKIWEFAEAEQPALVAADKNCLVAEYNCLYGIAENIHVLDSGNFVQCFNPGRCNLVIAGNNGRVWYFAEERLDKTYRQGNFPRYSDADADAFVKRNADMPIRPGLTLATLWANTVSAKLVPIEEGKFQLWTWGRIALLGDSAHKSTPNLGSGGNAAIESAAALANEIKLLSDGCSSEGRGPTLSQIRAHLETYQRDRQHRAEAVVDASFQLCRMHNLNGLQERFFVRFILPYFGEFLTEMVGQLLVGAEKLDFLPLTARSLRGTRPFNPSQGYGKHESRAKRAVWALPLLVMAGVAFWAMNINTSLPWAKELRDSLRVELAGAEVSVPIVTSFYRVGGLDHLFGLLNMYFLPSILGYDPVARRQLLVFLVDGSVLIAIWMIESIRRANFLTVMQLPFVFLLAAQVLSGGVTIPFYCFLHYVFSPVEKFSATDQRMTRRNWTPAVLPALLLSCGLPTFAMFFWPDLLFRQTILFYWQLYPVWASLAFRLAAQYFPDTTDEDKVTAPKSDLPAIRFTIAVAVVLAAATWLWSWTTGPFTMADIFLPVAFPRAMPDLTSLTREFMKLDYAFSLGGQLLWLLYLFWDVKSAGMVQTSWPSILVAGAVSLAALGPGATLGIGWLWREDAITNKRHKDALTEDRLRRR